MKLLKRKTQKLLAAAIAHDGKITLYARKRSGAAMKDLPPTGRAAVSDLPTNFSFSVVPGTEAVVSVELSCWRPNYPFVSSFYIGAESDWPFGAGDLPQVGATTPNVGRDSFEFTFNPVTRLVSWTNTGFASGRLQLDDTNLTMTYLSIRLFSATATPQATMELWGGITFGNQTKFRI